jgi:hypothetical protein
MTKIESKSSIYPHSHFIEHMLDAFEKSPWKNDLMHGSSSFLSDDSRARLTAPEATKQEKISSLEISFGAQNREGRTSCQIESFTRGPALGIAGRAAEATLSKDRTEQQPDQ